MEINKCYKLTYCNYMDEDKYKAKYVVVTVPDKTMNRLNANERFPFYKFIVGEGHDLFICYDYILSLEEYK